MEKKLHGSLRATMLRMTLFPLLILGMVITIFSAQSFLEGMQGEVRSGLKNLALSVKYAYDIAYPGDYVLVGTEELYLKKGDAIISGDYQIVDKIKEETGVEVTLFYYDARIVTTLMDEQGERQIGSGAHALIIKNVLEAESEHFFSSVMIQGVEYFAYYTPLFNSDGSIVGMIGVAKTVENVEKVVYKAILPILIFAAISMILTAFISIRFTDRLVKIIKKIKEFLGQIAVGNLNGQLNEKVLDRQDELGEMGRFTIHLQKSLRELIEYDALTGIFNRRSGEMKLKLLMEKAEKNADTFCVVLGDIDFFKKFNDVYGHECGDEVLRQVSQLLKKTIGKKGFVARWGGEEFLIVMDRIQLITCEQEIWELLERIRELEVSYGGESMHVTMTFGIHEGNGSQSVHEVLKAADEKLYEGKLNGRNRVER